MNRIIILIALALGLPLSEAQAGDLDDLTMQVMESNDPSETINEIELPDIAQEALHHREHNRDFRDASQHDLSPGLDDSVNEVESEVEGKVDDSRNDAEEGAQESRDEVVDDSRDEVVDDTQEEVRDHAEEGHDHHS
jgi:hypothetical protein